MADKPTPPGKGYKAGSVGPVPTRLASVTRTPVNQPQQVGQGRVSFASTAPMVTISCGLGDGPTEVTHGKANWSIVDRPRRKSGLEYQGEDLDQLKIPILLDRLTDKGFDVEREIKLFESLCVAPDAPEDARPPTVRISGMVPHRGKTWVITDLAFGDAIWRGVRRVRQELTVTVVEYEPLDLITSPVTKRKKASSTRTYVVKSGDTLTKIAVRELGAKGAKEIQAAVAKLKSLNGIRDPKSVKPGTKLKLPRATVIFNLGSAGTGAGLS